MAKWLLLPGMGADSRMFCYVKSLLSFDVCCLDWSPRGEKTFADVANSVIRQYQLDNGFVVVGTSFGGIVALEMAQILKELAVVVIGSPYRPTDVRLSLRLLSKLCIRQVVTLLQVMAQVRRPLVYQMFASSNPNMISTMCRYITLWPGIAADSKPRAYRIHGERDHVIRCPSDDCSVIHGAGHLVVMTHPKEIAKILECINAQLCVNGARVAISDGFAGRSRPTSSRQNLIGPRVKAVAVQVEKSGSFGAR